MTSGAAEIVSGVDVRRLMYFASIVEHGSMGKAAVALDISQPALSLAMDKLEIELGTPLLIRNSKGVAPTERGEALFRHTRGILDCLEAVEREFRRGDGQLREVLRFGCLPTLAGSVIASAIPQWQASHPGIELHVTECPQNELLWALLRRECDFSIGVMDATNYAHGLRQRVLFREQLRVIARQGHPLEKADAIEPKDLIRFPWVSPTAGWRNTALERILEPAGLTLQHRVTVCSSITLLKSLIGDSDHLALLPAHAVRDEVLAGRLQMLPFRGFSLERGIAVFHREGSHLNPDGIALVHAIEVEGRRADAM